MKPFFSSSSFAHEEAQRFGDDLVARRAFAEVDYGDTSMLWRAGDRRGLLIWIGLGAMAAATFLIGFKVNSAQSFAALSVEGLLTIAHYWLSILGAVPALGNTTNAIKLEVPKIEIVPTMPDPEPVADHAAGDDRVDVAVESVTP